MHYEGITIALQAVTRVYKPMEPQWDLLFEMSAWYSSNTTQVLEFNVDYIYKIMMTYMYKMFSSFHYKVRNGILHVDGSCEDMYNFKHHPLSMKK